MFFIKFAEGTALLDELKKKAICSAPEQNTDQPNVKEGALMLQVSNLSNVNVIQTYIFSFVLNKTIKDWVFKIMWYTFNP